MRDEYDILIKKKLNSKGVTPSEVAEYLCSMGDKLKKGIITEEEFKDSVDFLITHKQMSDEAKVKSVIEMLTSD